MKKLLFFISLFLIITTVYAQTYFKSTKANLIAVLQDTWGNPRVGNCTAYIFYPDMSLYRTLNLSYNPIAGVYYAEFTVPNQTGTYLEVVKCKTVINNKTFTIYARKTFFVSDALNEFQNDIHNLVQNASINVTVDITGNITQGMKTLPKEVWKFFKMMEVSGVTLDDPQECINETHLKIYTTRHVCIGNDCFDINSTEIRECRYGCDTVLNQCNPDPIHRNLMIVGVIFGLLLLIGIIYVLVRRR